MAELTAELRQQILDALLALPGINNRQTRDQLLPGLPAGLVALIERSEVPRIDLSAIVGTAEQWSREALDQLLANAGTWAEGSEAGLRVRALRGQLQRRRVFLSYKRDIEPDQPVATQVFAALSRDHNVFIDQTIVVGTDWAAQIEQELRQADYLIVFLSAQAVQSEMLLAEVALADRLRQEQGRPAILPVRLAYADPFQYPLSEYLNALQWAVWREPADTPALVAALRQALAGNALPAPAAEPPAPVPALAVPPTLPSPTPYAQPAILEQPEGTMSPQSVFYVERPTDPVAQATIRQAGVTITIKGPRQMGKSSLLLRTLQQARTAGKRGVLLDFQLFDHNALGAADPFLRQFCAWLSHKLKVPDQTETYWCLPLGATQRCTAYVEEYLLPELADPLVLAMDEVDRVFDTEFRSDFFGMLRNWHNERSDPESVWKQLDLVLVTSTEPYQLIANLNQSPFNVGQVLELADFTAAQVADLNQRHSTPLPAAAEGRLLALVGGQPYLVRRALYLTASGQLAVDDLFVHALDDRGPFGDHLRYHLFRLHDKPDLVTALRRVLRGGTSLDEALFFRLRGAGLVKREGGVVVPRCALYAAYFKERLPG